MAFLIQHDNENFVSFGLGRRDCMGRRFAIIEMCAIFSMMISRYKFVASHGLVNIQQAFGILLNVYPPIGINIEKR